MEVSYGCRISILVYKFKRKKIIPEDQLVPVSTDGFKGGGPLPPPTLAQVGVEYLFLFVCRLATPISCYLVDSVLLLIN